MLNTTFNINEPRETSCHSQNQFKNTEESKMSIAVWKERWSALNVAIDGYIEELEKQQDPQIVALKNLLIQLRIFGKKQFDFFYMGFSQGILEEVPETSPENALYVITDQIANDLEIIQRAASQRCTASVVMKQTLVKAERIAWDALQPAIDIGLISEPPAIITYFQKSTSIRIIPYAHIALIGIPYTCIKKDSDFIAIYHEIGHFVYWKGVKKSGKKTYEEISENILNELDNVFDASKSFDDFPHWCYDWREEFFADIYGCRVGRMAMSAGFQEWLLRTSLAGFFENDGKHPAPFLRAHIYTKTLTNFKKDPQVLINKLENQWNTSVTDQKNRTVSSPTIPNLNTKISTATTSLSSARKGSRSQEIRELREYRERKTYREDIKIQRANLDDAFDPNNAVNPNEIKEVDAIGNTVAINPNYPVDIVIQTIIKYLTYTPQTAHPTNTLAGFANWVQGLNALALSPGNTNVWSGWISKFDLNATFSSSTNTVVITNGNGTITYTLANKLPNDIWAKPLLANGWITGPVDNPKPK